MYSNIYIRPSNPNIWNGHCKLNFQKFLKQQKKNAFFFHLSDEDQGDLQKLQGDNKNLQQSTGQLGQNPFLDIPEAANAVEYKKGYVMRKCCYDVNYKKSMFFLFFFFFI